MSECTCGHGIKIDGNTSDAYHTFNELYDHRIELWITVCRILQRTADGTGRYAWRSTTHSDGSSFEGWFVLGISSYNFDGSIREQLTYHLPMSRWGDCGFAVTCIKSPEWDGHTSADVLERLKRL